MYNTYILPTLSQILYHDSILLGCYFSQIVAMSIDFWQAQ